MKNYVIAIALLSLITASGLRAQEIQTLFKGTAPLGAYGAISNKFTSIRGEFANLAEVYGGIFIKRKMMIGLGAAALTNDLKVPDKYSVDPTRNMSWEYAQFGLMTEVVIGSNKIVHLNVSLFSGAGMTVQYERYSSDWDDDHQDIDHNENFFYVIEPGIQAEVNLFRWMRLSPGVSYRKAVGSDAAGMSDNDISNLSYNVTLKFGKF
jgi:hypothetical protein